MNKNTVTPRLCELAKAGKIKKIVKLARDPGFVCMKCGRVAGEADNLCKPKSFD